MSATTNSVEAMTWKTDGTAVLYNFGYDIGFAGLPLDHDGNDTGPDSAAYCRGWQDGARALNPDQPVAAAPAENIRLLVWDLDDTFWDGTLEEGGITLIPAHVEMVKTLSARGIVNSIASKNHPDRARTALEQAGIWDHFVLPQIAFLPKGELVRSLIETCQLRAPSVLFVDDNPMNLNEVAHYNPGIQTAGPEFLADLLADPRFAGKDDPQHTRLQKYKILEQRAAERLANHSDNTAFLRQSDIRISIHHNIFPEFERVHELINRTNQLNFTKKRLTPDVEAARAEMRHTIDTVYNCQAAYIKVADRYGYYGICGFYMLVDHRMEHFLFSCRALNMGVEQLIYQKLNHPFPVVGEVVSDPAAPLIASWITVVDDAEANLAIPDPSTLSAQSICLRGGCEMDQAAHYLRERHAVYGEVAYANGPWGIMQSLTDYIALRSVAEDPVHAALFDRPWFDRRVLESRVLTGGADIYVLSFGNEPYVFRYRHKQTGIVLPIVLNAFGMDDLTEIDYATASAQGDLLLSESEWNELRTGFERVWRFNEAEFRKNIATMLDYLSGKRVIVILANSRHGNFHAVNELNASVNEAAETALLGRDVSVLRLDDIIRNDSEVLDMNHFRREVYMRLTEQVQDVLESPARRVAVPQPGGSSPSPRRNILPVPDRMAGEGWGPLGGAIARRAAIPGRFEGSVVMCHLLTRPTLPNDDFVFGCNLPVHVMPGEIYALSAWIMIPANFRGTGITICGAGYVSPRVNALLLHRRDAWQHLWVTVQVPLSASGIYPVLSVIGAKDDEVFSTGWKLEHGQVATEYVPPQAPTKITAIPGFRRSVAGINNQKLSLLGVFLAASKATPAEMHLPDMVVYDQLAEHKPSVPLDSVFSRSSVEEFARNRGIAILPGLDKADADGFDYFYAAGREVGMNHNGPGSDPEDFICDFFRHLKPRITDTPIFTRLSDTVFAAVGISVVVQLRIERDWIIHAEQQIAPTVDPWAEDYAPGFQQIIAKLAKTLSAECRNGAYVVCDEAALPTDKETIRAAAMQDFGIRLVWKSDILSADEIAAMTVLDLSLLDFEMAVSSPIFVGTTRSTFSNQAAFERYARTRAAVTTHYIYNLPGPDLAVRTDNGVCPFPVYATQVLAT